MLRSIEIAHAKAASLNLPTLMIVAGDDHLVDASGSQAFYSLLPTSVGTMHVYPQLYHEIFNEIESKQVFDDVRSWLQTH
jgi:alpha-beta hydrolase superfamily lysophospholipase